MPHHLVACFPLLSCYLVILLTQILVVVTSDMDQRFGVVDGDQRKLQGNIAAGREWEISSISFHLHRNFFSLHFKCYCLECKRGWWFSCFTYHRIRTTATFIAAFHTAIRFQYSVLIEWCLRTEYRVRRYVCDIESCTCGPVIVAARHTWPAARS